MHPETIVRRQQEFAANLARIREFLGFDPCEAVAAGKRRGWIQDPTPSVKVTDPAGAAPQNRGNRAAPCHRAIVEAVKDMGQARPFGSREIRFHPRVLAVTASRITVELVLRELIASGELIVLERRRGSRPALYALRQPNPATN